MDSSSDLLEYFEAHWSKERDLLDIGTCPCGRSGAVRTDALKTLRIVCLDDEGEASPHNFRDIRLADELRRINDRKTLKEELRLQIEAWIDYKGSEPEHGGPLTTVLIELPQDMISSRTRSGKKRETQPKMSASMKRKGSPAPAYIDESLTAHIEGSYHPAKKLKRHLRMTSSPETLVRDKDEGQEQEDGDVKNGTDEGDNNGKGRDGDDVTVTGEDGGAAAAPAGTVDATLAAVGPRSRGVPAASDSAAAGNTASTPATPASGVVPSIEADNRDTSYLHHTSTISQLPIGSPASANSRSSSIIPDLDLHAPKLAIISWVSSASKEVQARLSARAVIRIMLFIAYYAYFAPGEWSSVSAMIRDGDASGLLVWFRPWIVRLFPSTAAFLEDAMFLTRFTSLLHQHRISLEGARRESTAISLEPLDTDAQRARVELERALQERVTGCNDEFSERADTE